MPKCRLDCIFRVVRNLILKQERLYAGNRPIDQLGLDRLPMYRRFYYNAIIAPVRVILNTCLIEIFLPGVFNIKIRFKKKFCIHRESRIIDKIDVLVLQPKVIPQSSLHYSSNLSKFFNAINRI